MKYHETAFRSLWPDNLTTLSIFTLILLKRPNWIWSFLRNFLFPIIAVHSVFSCSTGSTESPPRFNWLSDPTHIHRSFVRWTKKAKTHWTQIDKNKFKMFFGDTTYKFLNIKNTLENSFASIKLILKHLYCKLL